MFEERLRQFLRVVLGLIVLSPFLIWLWKIEIWQFPDTMEFLDIVTATFFQAGLSALLSLTFGVVLFFCSEGFVSERGARRAELVLLLPNLLPPLFVVLAMLSWGIGRYVFSSGLPAVVATHALINSGLVAVGLRRLFEQKMGGMLELAWIEGASKTRLFFGVVLPFLKADIAAIFLFVFSICMTSFSIPLVLGGVQATSFEIAIYQAIRIDGAWAKAVVLAALQSVSLLAVALLMPRPFWPAKATRYNLRVLAWPHLRTMVALPVGFLAIGWGLSFLNSSLHLDPDVLALMPMALLNSIVIGLGVGALHLELLLLVAYLVPHSGLTRFLNGYMAPSAVIIGFAFLLIPGESIFAMKMKLILALSLWSFPFLYRWLGHATLTSVGNQMAVARTLGATHAMILWRIVYPQCSRAFFTSAGLAALWACGDFALTGILAGDQWTWALLIQDQMGSYNLDMASLMLIPLVALGFGCYSFFIKLESYVSR